MDDSADVKALRIFGRDVPVSRKLCDGYVEAMEIDEDDALSEIIDVIEREHSELRKASGPEIRKTVEDYLELMTKLANAPVDEEFLNNYIEELKAEGEI